jgi:hypothetical protein
MLRRESIPEKCETERMGSRLTRRRCLALMAGAASAGLAPRFCRGENGLRLLRLAASIDTLGGTNIQDASAGYVGWIDGAFRRDGIQTVKLVPGLYLPSEKLIQGVRLGEIDSFIVTTQEFSVLAAFTFLESIVIQDFQGDGLEYELLVHNNSPYKKLPTCAAHKLSRICIATRA